MHAIYTITHAPTGRLYVGSAVNVELRWKQHRQELTSRRHRNRKLQHAWNKYGEKEFVFSVIQEVFDPEDLLVSEQDWMDRLRPHYNIMPTAGSPLGYRHDDEAKRRIAEAAKARWSDPEGRKRWKGRSKLWRLTSPDGASVEAFNLAEFCRVNGLDRHAMYKVVRGVVPHHREWRLSASHS